MMNYVNDKIYYCLGGRRHPLEKGGERFYAKSRLI